MKIQVRTNTRPDPDSLVCGVEQRIPTVEIVLDGVIFTTDAPSSERALEMVRAIASDLLDDGDFDVAIPGEMLE